MTSERERLEKQWRKNNPSRLNPKTGRKAPPYGGKRAKNSRSSSSPWRRRKGSNSFEDRLIAIIGFIAVLLVLKHAPPILNVSKMPEVQQLLRYQEQKFPQKMAQKPISVRVGDSQALQQYDFTKIDKMGADINYQGTSVRELAQKLNAYANTDVEKARLIYAWVTHHIAYDFAGFTSGNYGDVSPQGVLMSRKGVCSGYANLYRELAQNMGLEAEVIEGYSKGYGYAVGDSTEANHAWNAVKINEAWYLIDSTWGAGHINNGQFVQKFKPFYFATPPHQFIYDHLPSDRQWQLLAQPYSKAKFENLPEVSFAFFDYGLNLLSHPHHTINVNSQAEIILTVPDNVVITADLSANNQTIENHTLIQKEQNQTKIAVTTPSSGTYNLNIYAKPKEQQGYYHHAISYRLIASQGSSPFPKIYQGFAENDAYLVTPLHKTLSVNQPVYFKLNVPNAQEVQIITKNGENWLPLSRSGNVFEGIIPIDYGKITVAAKFNNQSSYQSLVEYESR